MAEVLTLQERQYGNTNDPNDSAFGGIVTFTFDPPVGQVGEVHMLDIDDHEGGTIRAYDEDGLQIATRPILALGNNSFQSVPVDATNVARLDVELSGSGAISAITFCGSCGAKIDLANCSTCGNTVINGN